MRNFVTNFYKILDICKDFSKNIVELQERVKPGPKPLMSDLEVIALGITAEVFQIDSENMLFTMLGNAEITISNLISRRQYNDRRKRLCLVTEILRKKVAEYIDGSENVIIVDSKPVQVCKFARARRCKFSKSDYSEFKPSFGYCASQRSVYYGYKLHSVCGLSGVIHSYDFTKAEVHDINYLKDINSDYCDCTLLCDRAYISMSQQFNLFETANIRLEVPYRKNQKDYKPVFKAAAKFRKRIETVFSQLDDNFMMIRNYAKKFAGLFSRVVCKITAMTFLQYMNFVKGRPIGRIKYAYL